MLGRKSQTAVEKAAGENEERTIPQMQLRISNNIKCIADDAGELYRRRRL